MDEHVPGPALNTYSRPTGEGTARAVSRSFQRGWIRRPTEHDSPSPIRWERAGVGVLVHSTKTKAFKLKSARHKAVNSVWSGWVGGGFPPRCSGRNNLLF